MPLQCQKSAHSCAGIDIQPQVISEGESGNAVQVRCSSSVTPCIMCRCASLDGDADRLVYFHGMPAGNLQLLDGDRIAVLAALLIRDTLQKLPSDLPSPSVSFAMSVYRIPTLLWLSK